MIHKSFGVLVAIAFLSSSSKPVSDASTLQIIGFSDDGKYVAFDRFGTYDGSGFPYSEIFVVDVCKNAYATKSIQTIIEDEVESGEEAARERNFTKASSTLSAFNIRKGNNGRSVFKSNEKSNRARFLYNGAEAFVILEAISAGECAGIAQKKLKLSFQQGQRTVVLQNDKTVPKSRNCPYTYSIDEVILYTSVIAVVVSYQAPGFEGPDTRQLMVTACL